jgi:hypothetical protein
MSNTTIHCDGTATDPSGTLMPDVTYTIPPANQVGTGDGSAANPYTVVTTVQLTTTLHLVQTIRYVVGANTINQSAQLVSSGGAVTANIFNGVDIYLALDDYGFSYYVPKTGAADSNGVNVQIGGLNAIDTVTKQPAPMCRSANGTDPIGPGNFHEFLAPDAGANHFVEDNYLTVWGDLDGAIHTANTHLPDSALQPPFQSTNTCDDNGAAVEWDSVPSAVTIANGPGAPPAPSVVRDNIAFGPIKSTPSYVSSFSASRRQGVVTFRWRTHMASLLAGFYLTAGRHVLNRKIVPVHRSPNYVKRLRWSGHGPFVLHVVMRSGDQVEMAAH